MDPEKHISVEFRNGYLAERLQKWNRAPKSDLVECTTAEKEFIRALEETGIKVEYAQLSDMVLNCHNKYQFAKTYKALKRHLGEGFPPHPGLSSAANVAARKVLGRVVGTKLDDMAMWFIMIWDSRDAFEARPNPQGTEKRIFEHVIDRYAGGRQGCGGAIIAVLVSTVCLGTATYLVLFG